jgi:hypothetical protein
MTPWLEGVDSSPYISEAVINTSQYIYFFYGGGCQPPGKPPSWRATPCRLSGTAYSTYSQLPSISGGRIYQQPELDLFILRIIKKTLKYKM